MFHEAQRALHSGINRHLIKAQSFPAFKQKHFHADLGSRLPQTAFTQFGGEDDARAPLALMNTTPSEPISLYWRTVRHLLAEQRKAH